MNETLKPAPDSRQITENIWLCPDGVYRWTYEFPMLKNPVILFTVYKVLGISAGIVFLFHLVILLLSGDMSWNGLWGAVKLILLIAAIMLVLGLAGYLLLAASYGWKYMVLFEMTDEYVKHIQIPKQFEKAQAAAWLAAFVGLASGSPAAAGAGLLAAAKDTSTSEFKTAACVKVRRRWHTIHVNHRLDKNQVYADGADFDFVEKFIRERCVKAAFR